MANKKISQLTAAGPLTGTEAFPIVQGGVTVKSTINDASSVIGSPVFMPRVIYFGGTSCADVNIIEGDYSVHICTARELSAPNLVTIDGCFYLHGSGKNGIQTINLPLLETTSVYANNNLPGWDPINDDSLYINDWGLLTTIDISSLTVVKGRIAISSNLVLSTLNISSLSEVGSVQINGNASLTTFDISSITSIDGDVYLDGNGLDQSTVDAVLAKLVAINYSNKVVDISGGTNAVPGAQGLLDKATLEANGCTVNIN